MSWILYPPLDGGAFLHDERDLTDSMVGTVTFGTEQQIMNEVLTDTATGTVTIGTLTQIMNEVLTDLVTGTVTEGVAQQIMQEVLTDLVTGTASEGVAQQIMMELLIDSLLGTTEVVDDYVPGAPAAEPPGEVIGRGTEERVMYSDKKHIQPPKRPRIFLGEEPEV